MRKLWFVVFLEVFSTCVSAQTDTASKSVAGEKDAVLSDYGKLPLSFESNKGQVDDHVKFVFHGRGLSLFLTHDEAVVALRKASPLRAKAKGQGGNPLPIPSVNKSQAGATVRMQLLGANPGLRPEGAEELPGKANYFIGNDPSKWRTNVPTYAKVKYERVYPGVDLVYYGHEGQLEYDFVLAPGADPQRIRLKVRGAGRLKVDEKGDLLLGSIGSQLRLEKPVIYQTAANGKRKTVEGGYVVKGSQVKFEVARYDHSRPLVIDPTLAYSTYLGGSGGEVGGAIAADALGNAYITGYTGSSDFPITSRTFQTTFAGGGADVFISKLNPAGSALVYSTYLGGSGFEQGTGIAVDGKVNAYVTGWTDSPDFPTTPGAFQTKPLGGENAFITKLNPAGSALVYSTYLGGSGNTVLNNSAIASGIAIDASGNAYVTGLTNSSDFPTTPGAFQTTLRGTGGGGFCACNAFVSKLNPTGSALVYSTYLGGSDTEESGGIAADASGNAYVTGWTDSSDFPTTPGAFQTRPLGGSTAFITKLNPAGSALVYSTYLRGSLSTGGSIGSAIAIDAVRNAYVTGYTITPDFPTTAGAFQTKYTCNFTPCYSVFVSKLNAAGSNLIYSTFLGGSGFGEGGGIAVDALGNTYVTGRTAASDFPITPDAFQSTLDSSYGIADAFVSILNPAGSALIYSTYLGGSEDEDADGAGIAIDTSGNAYVTGSTFSPDFPTTQGAFQTQTSLAVGEHAYVAKIALGTVRSLKESVLSQLEQLMSNAPKGEQTAKLREAIKDLSDSLAPALWVADGKHLNFPSGREVFDAEERAVMELSKQSAIPAEVLQGYISNLVNADQMLASTAISDARGIDQNDLARANKFLAEGNEDATAGQPGDAISDYKEAWVIISACLDKK